MAIFGDYDDRTFDSLNESLDPITNSPSESLNNTPSLSNFRFGVAGWFLLAFILPVSIIITTVNNNIYNYSYKYKYKKKHKLLNLISK